MGYNAAASAMATTASEIFRLVQADLVEVESDLLACTRDAIPLIDDMNRYLHSSGGKRLRPAILLLCARMCNADPAAARKLAGVVELIHVATLVHDDIIDNAEVRRGQPAANEKWGNQATVLMGDWMYMTSFHIALEIKDFRVLDTLIDITRTMVTGELLQLEKNSHLEVSVEEHLDICVRKTACLFAGCSRLSGIVSKVPIEQEEALGRYGHALGMAFQLTDDLLDFTSRESVLGKPVLKDLEEGKVTVPVIHLMSKATGEEKDFVRGMVQTRDFSSANKNRMLELLERYGSLSELRSMATGYADQAIDALGAFHPSIYRDALSKIPELVLSRGH